ncbi:hypothetical protein OH76DRAFT_367845 [Lentinus brumalis]|uniref:Uncharacterized protein n=1 Tax=Lentinus brumalis TaxID=2498619 RepID=A0A371DEE9_9APHY|nr:hypothetical protein OH76DRAFT_367845 [Polyporus brumalis]
MGKQPQTPCPELLRCSCHSHNCNRTHAVSPQQPQRSRLPPPRPRRRPQRPPSSLPSDVARRVSCARRSLRTPSRPAISHQISRPSFTPPSSVPRRTRCFFRAISSADSAFSAHASLSHRGTPDCLRTARSNDTVRLPRAPYRRTLSLTATLRHVSTLVFSRKYAAFPARQPSDAPPRPPLLGALDGPRLPNPVDAPQEL